MSDRAASSIVVSASRWRSGVSRNFCIVSLSGTPAEPGGGGATWQPVCQSAQSTCQSINPTKAP